MTRLAPIVAVLALPLIAACVDKNDTPDTGADDYAAY